MLSFWEKTSLWETKYLNGLEGESYPWVVVEVYLPTLLTLMKRSFEIISSSCLVHCLFVRSAIHVPRIRELLVESRTTKILFFATNLKPLNSVSNNGSYVPFLQGITYTGLNFSTNVTFVSCIESRARDICQLFNTISVVWESVIYYIVLRYITLVWEYKFDFMYKCEMKLMYRYSRNGVNFPKWANKN